MRLNKLGKIFDPREHALPSGCAEYAQSPQALVFDDFVRIYYSTRSVDASGKYLSHVTFVDFDRSLREVIRTHPESVLPLGKLGCFDEHGIFPMNVMRTGTAVFGYTCGWSRRVSVSVETAIGLAVSHDDGITFHRVGDGPVLGPSPQEPFLVGDGFVRVFNGTFHMWYIFGVEWRVFNPAAAPDRIYKIGHATSQDGVTWSRTDGQQIVSSKLGPDESQALPSVVEIDGVYHMFFCYRYSSDFRSNSARGYRIGHAKSEDLETWVRDDEDPLLDVSPGSWDSDMLCYPHAFALDDRILILYNGNEFGRFGFGLAELER